MATLASLIVRVSADTRDFEQRMTSAHKRIQDTGTKLRRLGGSMMGLGQSLTVGVTAPIVAVGALSVSAAAKFETSMAQVKVATDASGKEMASLGKLAKKMGADTIFSAGESADAMLELAKAGMKPAEIQAGALKSTLDLAAASGMGLAESAVVMGAGMNTFGLKSKDSVQIVDALAGAANASSANVDDLALALQQVGAQASTSGFSIQETTAGLAALADAGIRGSDAGTSLKVFLQRLIPTSDEAAEAMKNLGLEFFDSKGKMKSLKDIAGQLKKGFTGLTQEQRLAKMQTIFGSDAIRAATILYDEGEDGIAKYIEATSKSGSAAEMAAAKMKGISGALDTMKGSIETAQLALGDALAPTIVSVAGTVTDLTNQFTALPVATQQTVVAALAVAAATGPLLIGLGAVINAVGALSTAFTFLAANPIVLVLAAVAAAIGYVALTAIGALPPMGGLERAHYMVAESARALKGAEDDYRTARAASKDADLQYRLATNEQQKANERVKKAQEDVTTAVNQFGKDSPQAKQATQNLTDAKLGLEGADIRVEATSKILTETHQKENEKLGVQATKTKEANDRKREFVDHQAKMDKALKDASPQAEAYILMWDSIAGTIRGAIGTLRTWLGLAPQVQAPKLHPNSPRLTPVPALASGGIVTKPTFALIGEAGPEAVVPLSKGQGLAKTFERATPTEAKTEIHIAKIELSLPGVRNAKDFMTELQSIARMAALRGSV